MATQEQAFTFTRASTKWVFDGTGTLVEVPADQPAYDHDPVTGEPLGLLIEESRTNLLLWSEDMTNDGVRRQNCDISVSSETSPVQGKSAFTITTASDGVVGADPGVFSVVAGRKYTATVIAKAGTANEIGLVFKEIALPWQAGSVRFNGELDPTTGPAWKLEEQYTTADGWTFARVSCVAEQDSSSASVQIRITHDDGTPVAGQTIHVAYWGLEEGEGTSIVPTTDAPATRAADNVSRTLGDEFNPREGTFVFRVSDIDKARGQTILNIMEAGSVSYGPRIQVGMDLSGSVGVACVSDNDGSSSRGLTPATANPVFAISFKSGEPILYSMNGEIAPEYAVNSPTNLGLITFSNASGNRDNQMNTSVALTGYYPRALTGAELVELTS